MNFSLVIVLVGVIGIAGCGSEDKTSSPESVGGKNVDDSSVNNAGRKQSVSNQETAGKKSAKEGKDGLLEEEMSVNPPGRSGFDGDDR